MSVKRLREEKGKKKEKENEEDEEKKEDLSRIVNPRRNCQSTLTVSLDEYVRMVLWILFVVSTTYQRRLSLITIDVSDKPSFSFVSLRMEAGKREKKRERREGKRRHKYKHGFISYSTPRRPTSIIIITRTTVR